MFLILCVVQVQKAETPPPEMQRIQVQTNFSCDLHILYGIRSQHINIIIITEDRTKIPFKY